jgi:hypothetical protein
VSLGKYAVIEIDRSNRLQSLSQLDTNLNTDPCRVRVGVVAPVLSMRQTETASGTGALRLATKSAICG